MIETKERGEHNIERRIVRCARNVLFKKHITRTQMACTDLLSLNVVNMFRWVGKLTIRVVDLALVDW